MITSYPPTIAGEAAAFATPEPRQVTFNGVKYVVASGDDAPQDNSAWNEYRANAESELVASDMVAFRCFKASVAFPLEWLGYVNVLRAIVGTSAGDASAPFPVKPEYPAGT